MGFVFERHLVERELIADAEILERFEQSDQAASAALAQHQVADAADLDAVPSLVDDHDFFLRGQHLLYLVHRLRKRPVLPREGFAVGPDRYSVVVDGVGQVIVNLVQENPGHARVVFNHVADLIQHGPLPG